ncbi:hypothetical protein IJF86_01720 [Candidatus Saccharibacteria bacterium]|nr:hypothetical protein [Candidatus Saccharibacteria bacterium]
MEGNKSGTTKTNTVRSRAILVFGAPCSGKTTFCEKFAKRFKAPYFDFGVLAHDYKLDRKMITLLIEQIAKTGQMLVIEGGLDSEADRNEIRKILRNAGYVPSLVWIQTDVGTIRARLKTRLKSVAKAKAEYEEKIDLLEAPTDFEEPIVLSGKHTFETQLRHVLSQLK